MESRSAGICGGVQNSFFALPIRAARDRSKWGRSQKASNTQTLCVLVEARRCHGWLQWYHFCVWANWHWQDPHDGWQTRPGRDERCHSQDFCAHFPEAWPTRYFVLDSARSAARLNGMCMCPYHSFSGSLWVFSSFVAKERGLRPEQEIPCPCLLPGNL